MNEVIARSDTALSTKPNGFSMFAHPETYEAAYKMAEMLAKSDLVPKCYQGRPGDIMIAGAMGHRLGLDIFASVAGIAVINARATIWGDAMLASCMDHPAWEDYQESLEGEGDAMQATCTVKRKGRAPYSQSYSVADAKKAGLWGKAGSWSTTPKRMLQMRARAFALRGTFTDRLAGFHAREEMEGVEPEKDVEGVVVIPDAKPAKRRIVKEAMAIQEHPADFTNNGTPPDNSPAQPDAPKVPPRDLPPVNQTPPADGEPPAWTPPVTPIIYTDIQMIQECNSAVDCLGKDQAEAIIKNICSGLGVKKVIDIAPVNRHNAVLAIREAYGK